MIALALVPGCTAPPIEIDLVRAKGHVVALLSQTSGLLFTRHETPCVRMAALYRREDGPEAPLWKIEASSEAECPRLDALLLGETPKGFRQVAKLPRGTRGAYRLWVYGIGSGEADVTL